MTAKVLPGPGFSPLTLCESFSALIYSSSSVPSVHFPRVRHILPSPTQSPLGHWDIVPGVQSRIPDGTSLIYLCPEILIPSLVLQHLEEAQRMCGAEGALGGHGSDTTGSPFPLWPSHGSVWVRVDPTSTLPSWLPIQLLYS